MLLDGRDVTHLSAPERAQLGIRRSFQITSVFSELTVIANAVLACQAIRGGTFQFWRPVRADADLYELPPDELAKIATVPGSLDKAIDALEADHEFLLKGDVFTPDVIDTWIAYKTEREIDQVQLRPHPWEFYLYYDI